MSIFVTARRFFLPRTEIRFVDPIFRFAKPIFATLERFSPPLNGNSLRRTEIRFAERNSATATPVFYLLSRFSLSRSKNHVTGPICALIPKGLHPASRDHCMDRAALQLLGPFRSSITPDFLVPIFLSIRKAGGAGEFAPGVPVR